MTEKTAQFFLLWCILGLTVFLCFCSCSSERPETGRTAEQTPDRMQANRAEPIGSVTLSAPIESEKETGPEAFSKNSPKLDKAGLRFETVNGIDCLKVMADGSDKNGNKVSFRFEWTKNDKPAGEGDTISGFKRGDKISVMITPFDDQGYGLARNLSAEIKNTPPKITEHEVTNFDGKVWSYQVKATDPDGDPLTYSLKSAPPGMTIDPSTGLVKWNVPPDFKGKASFTVSVADGHGGEATQSLSFEISPQQKKP
jgi:hypothetical protein